jgi:hypothetical protein
MDSERFDQISKGLATGATRRTTLGVLAALGVAGASGLTMEARRKKKRKKKLGLRSRCTPGKSKCKSGLKCDAATTRHTCSDTVMGVDDWCCVPPGGSCSECDCCGDFYCEFDDNNEPHCVPNPEG